MINSQSQDSRASARLNKPSPRPAPDRRPGQAPGSKDTCRSWIPAFVGMTLKDFCKGLSRLDGFRGIKGIGAPRLMYYLFLGVFFLMPMGTSPRLILGGCVLFVWLFSGEFIRNRRQYLHESWLWPVLAMVALTWGGLLYTADLHGLGIKYAVKTYYWLFALALVSVRFEGRSAENLINAFLIGLALNAFVGFLQFLEIVPVFSRFGTVYTGLDGGYNTLEIMLVLGMLISSFLFRSARDTRGKVINAGLILIYFFHLTILIGRGGHLTFIILSPFIVYNIVYHIFQRRRLIAMGIIYLLLIIAMFSSPLVRDRFDETVNAARVHLDAGGDYTSGKKYSAPLDRIFMWRWALSLFVDHPFIGVGTGGNRKAILAAGGDMGIDHPHNNILHMAVSYGVLGLFVFGWLFWVLLKAGWRGRDRGAGFFVLSSSLVILVGGLTDTHILDSGGAFLLALTTGLQTALPHKEGRYGAR